MKGSGSHVENKFEVSILHALVSFFWEVVGDLPNGQSSPGILQSVQQPSNDILQIPQLSSFAIQCQLATPVHLLTGEWTIAIDTFCTFLGVVGVDRWVRRGLR